MKIKIICSKCNNDGFTIIDSNGICKTCLNPKIIQPEIKHSLKNIWRLFVGDLNGIK